MLRFLEINRFSSAVNEKIGHSGDTSINTVFKTLNAVSEVEGNTKHLFLA